MQATLTDLARNTKSVLRPVTNGGQTVIVTEHGKPVAKISPMRTFDRKAALKILKEMGPVNFLPR